MKRTLPLYKTLLSSFIELFYKPGRGKSAFPKELGAYSFVKELTPPTRPHPYYHYGLYRDENGKKYFVKQWNGIFKSWSLGAIMLYQEIQTSFLFNNSKKHALCKVLPVLHVFETSSQIFVVYPFITFSDFTTASTKKKYEAYDKAFKFLAMKSSQIRRKNVLSTRSPLMYVFQYLLFFTRSFSIHPSKRKLLIKGLFMFFSGYTDLKKATLTLAHRDLHLNNILLINNEQYLTDFALTTYTVQYYDLIRSYLYNLQEKALSQKLAFEINLLISQNKITKEYVQSITIFMLTHLLSVKGHTKEVHDRFLACFIETVNDEIFTTTATLYKSSAMKKLFILLLDTLLIDKADNKKNKPFSIRTSGKTIIKSWSGTRRDLHYFDLLQEIYVYSLINTHQLYLSKEASSIAVPKLLAYKKTNTAVSLNLAHIASIKSPMSFIDQFAQISTFLEYLTSRLSTTEKKNIGHKGVARFILLSPLTCIKSIMRFPSSIGIFVSSFILGILTSPWIYIMSKNRVVHGDLHPENILFDGNMSYVIDFEQTHITSHLFEVATTLTSTKLAPKDQLQFRLYVETAYTWGEKIAIASLLYFNLLTTIANTPNAEKVTHYIERLQFAKKLQLSGLHQFVTARGGIV